MWAKVIDFSCLSFLFKRHFMHNCIALGRSLGCFMHFKLLMSGFYPAFKYPLDFSSGIVNLPRAFLFLLLKLTIKLNPSERLKLFLNCFKYPINN